jgi:hypothetical protein
VWASLTLGCSIVRFVTGFICLSRRVLLLIIVRHQFICLMISVPQWCVCVFLSRRGFLYILSIAIARRSLHEASIYPLELNQGRAEQAGVFLHLFTISICGIQHSYEQIWKQINPYMYMHYEMSRFLLRSPPPLEVPLSVPELVDQAG